MALCPFATHKLLPESATQPKITARAVIMHSAAGRGSLYRFFLNSSSLESHFWVSEKGVIEQYVDTGRRADANRNANSFAISIETESSPAATEPWAPAQLDAIVHLVRWCCDTHGIPVRQIPAWNSSGIGWHIQFGAPGPWTPVSKSCPGPARIRQMPALIAAVGGAKTQPPTNPPTTGGFLMALTDAEQREVLDLLRSIDLRAQAIQNETTDGANANLGGISKRQIASLTRLEQAVAAVKVAVEGLPVKLKG